MIERVALLFHLLGFATFLGGAFAQQQLVKASAKAGLAPAVRDRYEELAAACVTKAELPGIFVQMASGGVFLAVVPSYLTQGWLHAKLGCVAVLLVLSHVEMINARRIVKARRAQGDAAAEEIGRRKARHAGLGVAGTLLVVAVVLLSVFGR